MEIVKQMKDAIQYIEENLLEDITYVDVANHVFLSPFHFHRTFKVFTNITPGGYIRNRRLSNAGEEIKDFSGTLLDLALKYQYDTLEGFSKAFKKFHGSTPSDAKAGEVDLSPYHPLAIDISFKGGQGMKYKIVELEPFKLIGKSRDFEVNAEVNLIPSFWDEEIKNGLLKRLDELSSVPGIYGYCHQEDLGLNTFSYGIAMKTDSDTEQDGLEYTEITHPLWAVFECHSADHIGETWEYILKQFLVNTDYKRVEELDFEFYPHGREDIFCELYIPVERT